MTRMGWPQKARRGTKRVHAPAPSPWPPGRSGERGRRQGNCLGRGMMGWTALWQFALLGEQAVAHGLWLWLVDGSRGARPNWSRVNRIVWKFCTRRVVWSCHLAASSVSGFFNVLDWFGRTYGAVAGCKYCGIQCFVFAAQSQIGTPRWLCVEKGALK